MRLAAGKVEAIRGMVRGASQPRCLVTLVDAMTLDDNRRVPWSDKLRRVDGEGGQPEEWMAPPDVVGRVRLDYLSAITWFQDAAMNDWAHLWAVAPMYLSGRFLQRYRALVSRASRTDVPAVVGVLRADHEISVRYFSAGGTRCLVVDTQLHRRMATYDRPGRARISTQDLGSGTVVYQMAFDHTARRWTIDALVQHLPLGSAEPDTPLHLALSSALFMPAGRDF